MSKTFRSETYWQEFIIKDNTSFGQYGTAKLAAIRGKNNGGKAMRRVCNDQTKGRRTLVMKEGTTITDKEDRELDKGNGVMQASSHTCTPPLRQLVNAGVRCVNTRLSIECIVAVKVLGSKVYIDLDMRQISAYSSQAAPRALWLTLTRSMMTR
jgi:hypothetical protein